jgi:galactarate dehydratase
VISYAERCINLHVFTTGRGTPYGLAQVPVIKVATRSDLARRWHDLMDVNAGRIADGTARSKRSAGRCSDFMLDVASGRHKTWAERWKLHSAGSFQSGTRDLIDCKLANG